MVITLQSQFHLLNTNKLYILLIISLCFSITKVLFKYLKS